MILTSATQAAWGWLETYLPFSSAAAGWINYGVTLVLLTLLFALIFRYLPDALIAWRDVWLGAFVTAILFGIGNAALSVYFRYSAVASAYGAAGSLVIFMLWAYYCAVIMYLGAEFTQVYARMYGSKIEPEDHAELTATASEANSQR
jgi:membrane protein